MPPKLKTNRPDSSSSSADPAAKQPAKRGRKRKAEDQGGKKRSKKKNNRSLLHVGNYEPGLRRMVKAMCKLYGITRIQKGVIELLGQLVSVYVNKTVDAIRRFRDPENKHKRITSYHVEATVNISPTVYMIDYLKGQIQKHKAFEQNEDWKHRTPEDLLIEQYGNRTEEERQLDENQKRLQESMAAALQKKDAEKSNTEVEDESMAEWNDDDEDAEEEIQDDEEEEEEEQEETTEDAEQEEEQEDPEVAEDEE
ncbi:MAG: hypothetical protein JSS82_13990 [Bacteroidetes bacterium]|nr:hypothetical protein [Bacteroidota bacterium]